ncbi:hypothetical protein [Mycobacteroides chelonae]|uniref:hypothetical protein n=1 Tax=Mycobacteroides chelonae TaxID=1774 RepID=UPI001E53D253|nr:hypothetical protein [Mycobacteroides chelonae]
MKSRVVVGAAALALLGAACSAQPVPAPSPSTHSASPLLTTTTECAGLAAEAPTRYSPYREQVLAAIREGVPAHVPGAAYRRIPTDQPWSRAFMALSTENVCVVDALSTAWGVDVRGWIYTKESGK